MKRHTINSFFAFGAIACSLAACSQDEAVLDNNIEDLQTYTLYLDADVPNFDSVREGETRASGNSWADGDVIYVSYSNGGNTKVSNATYKSSLGAFQFSSTSLNSVSDASCSVYYFRGGTFSVSGNTVTMDKFTAIFSDTSAKYSCSSNVITLSAAFKPYTWRLCFKGTAGTQVKLKSASNIVYNTSLNMSSGSFSTKADSVNLLVQSDGYTPYVYGLFTGSSNTVKVKVGGTYYSRSLSSSKLAVGQSGYFTVPTTGNHANWSTSRDKSGFEYVDLGLPSGTLWAKCNLGAFSEEEYGDFYAWGETSGYDGLDRTFNWSTYAWCSGTSSSLTKYNSSDGLTQLELGDDAAYVCWGSPWRTPTLEEWKELNDNTTKSNETINGINGRRLTSKINSNSIFLPFAGYFEGSEYKSAGTYANYWSSTLNSTKSQAYIAYTNNSGAIRTSPLDRCYTQAIRPVYDSSSDEGDNLDISYDPYGDDKNLDYINNGHEFVDLGLPSGTKWATCNIGANSPEKPGGYYAWGETSTKSSYTSSNYTYSGSSNLSGSTDAATVNWGASWRMPTVADAEELLNNCTSIISSINGVEGYLFTGPNGNTLFFPYTGFYEKNSKQNTWQCFYTLSDYYSDTHCYFFNGEYVRPWGDRYRGRPIRPVCN